MIAHAKHIVGKWLREETGLAATEAALIFPLLMTLLLGTFDLGYGILAAQKSIRASQVTADLIARHKSANDGKIEEAIQAGELSLWPFVTEDRYGVDIVSIEFDDEGEPVILWRETRRMSPNDDVLESLEGLGGPGEGLLAVTIVYQYNPVFSGFVIDEMTFQEVSYVRGRLSPTIPMEEG
jgi:hypothetical protein